MEEKNVKKLHPVLEVLIVAVIAFAVSTLASHAKQNNPDF